MPIYSSSDLKSVEGESEAGGFSLEFCCELCKDML